MSDTIQTAFLADDIAILTENVDGKLYLIEAKSFRDIVNYSVIELPRTPARFS